MRRLLQTVGGGCLDRSSGLSGGGSARGVVRRFLVNFLSETRSIEEVYLTSGNLK
jgi:hypothetical protein